MTTTRTMMSIKTTIPPPIYIVRTLSTRKCRFSQAPSTLHAIGTYELDVSDLGRCDASAALLRILMDRTAVARGINHLTIHLVSTGAHRPTRNGEYDGRNHEPGRSGDHKDETHGRESKAGPLIGDGPIHNCPRDSSN